MDESSRKQQRLFLRSSGNNTLELATSNHALISFVYDQGDLCMWHIVHVVQARAIPTQHASKVVHGDSEWTWSTL